MAESAPGFPSAARSHVMFRRSEERVRLATAFVFALGFFAQSAQCQLRVEPASPVFWGAAAAAVGASAVLDKPVQRFAERSQSRDMDRLAAALDPLGRARYLLPAMAGSYALARVAGRDQLSGRIVRIGLGYLAADAVQAALKPTIGRHRPDSLMRPWRLRPFSTGGEWHSFPSGHTVHAFSIAAGLSEEVDRPWVSVVAYGVAALVGAQRVYTSSHWSSDVVPSAVLAIAVSKTTNRWLRRRENSAETGYRGRRVHVVVLPGAILATAEIPSTGLR